MRANNHYSNICTHHIIEFMSSRIQSTSARKLSSLSSDHARSTRASHSSRSKESSQQVHQSIRKSQVNPAITVNIHTSSASSARKKPNAPAVSSRSRQQEAPRSSRATARGSSQSVPSPSANVASKKTSSSTHASSSHRQRLSRSHRDNDSSAAPSIRHGNGPSPSSPHSATAHVYSPPYIGQPTGGIYLSPHSPGAIYVPAMAAAHPIPAAAAAHPVYPAPVYSHPLYNTQHGSGVHAQPVNITNHVYAGNMEKLSSGKPTKSNKSVTGNGKRSPLAVPLDDSDASSHQQRYRHDYNDYNDNEDDNRSKEENAQTTSSRANRDHLSPKSNASKSMMASYKRQLQDLAHLYNDAIEKLSKVTLLMDERHRNTVQELRRDLMRAGVTPRPGTSLNHHSTGQTQINTQTNDQTNTQTNTQNTSHQDAAKTPVSFLELGKSIEERLDRLDKDNEKRRAADIGIIQNMQMLTKMVEQMAQEIQYLTNKS